MLSDARRAELAARLRRAAPPAPPSGLLRPFGTGNGSGPPVVLCHAVGGTVHGYAALAQALGDAFRVFGIEAPGLRAQSAPVTDLAELTARYANAVFEADGAHVLGGWSIGGIVAFEVARRLTEHGCRVNRLLLLDTPCRPQWPADLDPVLAFATDAARSLGWQQPPSAAADPHTDPEQRLDALARQLAGSADRFTDVRRDLRLRYEVFLANWRMVDGYRPAGPVSTDALIVCAKDSPNAATEWAELVTGVVRVLPVAGDHYSCLRPPWVQDIAAAIAANRLPPRAEEKP